MSIRVEFGSLLKKIRENQLVSQDVLAEHSGLLRHQIIAIEKGKSNYTVDNLFKYLHGLQVDSIDLKANEEEFEFELTGSSMTLETIREKVAEQLQYHSAWEDKLSDTEPGHCGINDSEVELSSDDVFVNIPQRSFEFKNAQFHFNVELLDSKDGVSHKNFKVADGNGTFRFIDDNKIKIEDIEIDVDLDLMA